LYRVRLGYGLWVGLVYGSKDFTLRWVGWVGSVIWWVGLDWDEEIGPTDNSEPDAQKLKMLDY